MDAKARVLCVLEAAQRIYAKRAQYLDGLVASSGLSPQGVLAAMDRAMERDVPVAELDRFLARAPAAEAAHVVLSSNVFTGCVRALAWAYACAPNVSAKPSRRERALFDLLAGELPSLHVVSDLSGMTSGVVHGYGSDASLDAIAREVRVPVVRFGSGFGVVSTQGSREDALAIAHDTALFDQRGCLSPRVIVIDASFAEACTFAKILAGALLDVEKLIPRGALFEREAAVHYLESMRAIGEVVDVGAGAVGCAETVWLPPSGRYLHVVPQSALTPPQIKLLKGASIWAGQHVPPDFRGRRCAVGHMQAPPFDGPVDLRTLFSSNLASSQAL